jgi:hypothetical protein
MYPQSYLKTFWRLELRPQVFVAMSFASQYDNRFKQVITPAIQSLIVDGKRLEPYRVDISKTGDSILTDISDGIAHSRLVLADVSSIGRDSVTGDPFRNANVMYEIGIALACRQPSDILLIRDDRDKFLFDVSTIPHLTIDFTNVAAAVKTLAEHLLARVREQRFVADARAQIAIASLSAEETILLKQMKDYTATTVWGREVKGLANWYGIATSRLLDKGIIKLAGEFQDDKPAFTFTPFGFVIHQAVNRGLRKFEAATGEPQIEVDNVEEEEAQPAHEPDA